MKSTAKFKIFTETLGEVTIEQRGKKGTYHVSFHFQGSHVRKTLKTSNKKKALKTVESVLASFCKKNPLQANDRNALHVDPVVNMISLTEGLEHYIESLVDKNSSPRDIQQARTRVSAFINFAHGLGIDDFSGVQPLHADAFFRGLTNGTIKTSGKPRKHHNTAVGYFGFTRACMEYLESRSLIEMNPWTKVRYARIDSGKTPKPILDHLNAILAQMEQEYFAAAAALAFLGCREEVLLRIKTRHVKLNDECIFIELPQHRTKTVQRYVPIHPRLMKVLADYKRPKSDYYFCDLRTRGGQRGSKMSAKNLNSAIQRAAKKAGFAAGRSEDGFVAHSFRGFFKSHCIKQGIPREIVDTWQGHTDGSVGMRHYFDLTIEESIEFMKKVEF